jgi:tRNA 5-methylaminomethyl-2-thiouridine biosynthesis bifunctional protein
MPRLPPQPDLDWTPDGAPQAQAFGDVYFSRTGGVAEAEAVFLAGCGLPEAWADRERFAICELGFGTGVNVLAAWRAWKTTRLPHAVLHISSVEAFPLARGDAARALSRFPELGQLTDRLLARWPVRAYAPQRLWFEEDRFALTLFTGEAETVLAGMTGRFDAWFLDGFAPSRNPAMWTPEVFRHVARLSAPGARAATFSVAGEVRRGLEAAGFEVEKKPGYGLKRERLEARFPQPPAPRPPTAGPAETPHAGGPRSIYPYAAAHPRRIAIIGGGIAGAACAHALGRRGVETIVLEAARELGAGASGNPAGLVMPRLDRGGGALSELFLAAYLEAIATYEAMGEEVFVRCGVEERAGGQAALADLLNDPPLPHEWFARVSDTAALHPRAGLVRPLAAIKHMLADAQLLFEAQVQSLDRSGEAWTLRAPDGRAMLKADAVVLACGAALRRFHPASFLPIALSRGQVEWGAGRSPEHALVRSNYVAPMDGGVLFGATFDQVGETEEASAPEEARARNMAALAELAPDIARSIDPSRLQSRASLRATTSDRAPIAGLLPDAPAWLAQYEGIAHGRKPDTDAPPPAHAGVYVIGGLGARGLTLAPLLGERIAAEMCGEPAPLSQLALDAIHPARFLYRALKRR